MQENIALYNNVINSEKCMPKIINLFPMDVHVELIKGKQNLTQKKRANSICFKKEKTKILLKKKKMFTLLN